MSTRLKGGRGPSKPRTLKPEKRPYRQTYTFACGHQESFPDLAGYSREFVGKIAAQSLCRSCQPPTVEEPPVEVRPLQREPRYRQIRVPAWQAKHFRNQPE